MCVIISSPSGKHRPAMDTLRACSKHNPHGSGLAWVQHNKVQWLKGLSADAIAELLYILAGPVVIHFRIATAGGKGRELSHPFPISPTVPLKAYGQAGAVLFHNGHWHDWQAFADEYPIELDGPVSDSRVIAAGVYHKGRTWLRKIPCRFAILARDGTELFGDWSEVQADGCRYSNLHWQPKTHLDRTPLAGEQGKAANATCKQPRPVSPSKPKQTNFLSDRNQRSLGLVREAMACFGD